MSQVSGLLMFPLSTSVGNENVATQLVLSAKQLQSVCASHFSLHFLRPLLHEHDIKIHNFVLDVN